MIAKNLILSFCLLISSAHIFAVNSVAVNTIDDKPDYLYRISIKNFTGGWFFVQYDKENYACKYEEQIIQQIQNLVGTNSFSILLDQKEYNSSISGEIEACFTRMADNKNLNPKLVLEPTLLREIASDEVRSILRDLSFYALLTPEHMNGSRIRTLKDRVLSYAEKTRKRIPDFKKKSFADNFEHYKANEKSSNSSYAMQKFQRKFVSYALNIAREFLNQPVN